MDPRDRAAETRPWYESLQEDGMLALANNEDACEGCEKRICEQWDGEGDEPCTKHTIEIPFKYEVCSLCDGKGKHVNPSIDAHGISSEEFADDPDFYDEYKSGMYDVTCYLCHGNRVVPVPDESRCNTEQKAFLKVLEEREADERAYQNECDYARRMGC